MKRIFNLFLAVLLFVSTVSFWGCTPPPQRTPEVTINPKDTIGSVTRYFVVEKTPVSGIGIVAGLAGTGSSECPPNIRQQLEKYIKQQVAGTVNARSVIDSSDTAVVEISGIIPPLSIAADTFDITLKPLSSTQTTSLDGGYLYTAELKEQSRLSNIEQFTQFSRTLATADGPVYTQPPSDSSQNQWYVLGGGKAKQNSFVKLILNQPDFITANAIRNRINERFGPKTAVAISTAEISLTFPVRYIDEKQTFLRIVKTPKYRMNTPGNLLKKSFQKVKILKTPKSPWKGSENRHWIRWLPCSATPIHPSDFTRLAVC